MTLDETRKKYLEELGTSTETHRVRAFEYEKLAVDYSAHIFRNLTYLNGGALIALPTAVALFGFDAKHQKVALVIAAACFIGGLLLVCLAQIFAFFTMARRAEAEQLQEDSQRLITGSTHYPAIVDPQKTKKEVDDNHAKVAEKIKASDGYRFGGILATWCSAAAFIVGCCFGVRAILKAPVYF